MEVKKVKIENNLLLTRACGMAEGAPGCILDVVGSSHVTNLKKYNKKTEEENPSTTI